MRGMKWVAAVAGAAGFVAGAVLAVPSGASAADGQPLVLGSDSNAFSRITELQYTGNPQNIHPSGAYFHWEDRDRTYEPGVWVHGGTVLDWMFTDFVATHDISAEDAYAFQVTAEPEDPSRTALTGQAGYAGRGAVLAGGVAQLKLQPSAGSHPKSGQLGDLFLDKSGKLWFCKGGTTWKQIA